MTAPTQIVLATDFSPASMSAVDVAGRLARTFNAGVTVLHIFQYAPKHRYRFPVEWMVEIIRTDVRKRLAETKGILQGAGVNAEVMVLEDGVPSQQILKFVHSFAAPVVVMGTHARGGIDRFVLGSTAEEVLRQAHCPVATVGPHVTPFIKDDPGFPKILYATDFSKASLAAAPVLAALRNAARAQLRILHVSPIHAAGVEEERERFDPVRQFLGENEGQVYVVLHGTNVAQAVVNDAERYPADFVVLGVKRSSAFVAHAERGIAFQIIGASPCAVLTVSS